MLVYSTESLTQRCWTSEGCLKSQCPGSWDFSREQHISEESFLLLVTSVNLGSDCVPELLKNECNSLANYVYFFLKESHS